MTLTLVLKKKFYPKEYKCEILERHHLPFKSYDQCKGFCGQTNEQKDRRTSQKLYAPNLSIRGHKKFKNNSCTVRHKNDPTILPLGNTFMHLERKVGTSIVMGIFHIHLEHKVGTPIDMAIFHIHLEHKVGTPIIMGIFHIHLEHKVGTPIIMGIFYIHLERKVGTPIIIGIFHIHFEHKVGLYGSLIKIHIVCVYHGHKVAPYFLISELVNHITWDTNFVTNAL